MTKKINKIHILGLALLMGLLSTIIAPVQIASANKNVRILMEPLYEKVELDPGTVHRGTFKMKNTGTEEYDYKIYAKPYNESDSGSPSYENESKYNLMTDWITFNTDNGHLSQDESVDVEYTIKVPNDAPGGGQYVAIIAEAVNNAKNHDGVEIGEDTRIAYLVYANINGETNECAKILDNSVNTFMFEPPINANSLVENCGNSHETVTYIIKASPLFSDKVVYTNEENPMVRTVLPETRRYNTLSWTKEDGAPLMGIYNVEQTVKIGKETSTIKKLVFIFPLWLVIIFILLIAAIIFWLVSRSRQRKESKRSSVNTPEKSSD